MEKRGYLFVLLTALVSGVSIFLNKFGVSGINPYIFTFAKNVLVALFIFSLIILFKDIKVFKTLTRTQWLKLVAIGLFGGSIPFLLFFKGLSMSSSTTSALLHKSMFIFVSILAVYFLKEKINKKFIIAALLLFAGNFALLNITSFNFGIPDLLISIAVLLWATETIISKYTLKELPSRVVAFGRMFFGVLFILVFLAATGNIKHLASLTVPQLGWILFTAVFLLVYVTTWYAGLKRVPASSAASILVLGSAITTALSIIYAGSFNFIDIAGIILIASGVSTLIGLSYITSKIKILLPSKN
ncbi:DMT family transporter [Candidatus Woesearchaeota archaeon]|nr:DMT family transporter [Candidatus Woesearchaeota archaeon]